MKNYKQLYNAIYENIKNRKEIINKLRNKINTNNVTRNELVNQLYKENCKLEEASSKQNKYFNKQDRTINVTATFIMLLVTAAIVFLGVKITSIPTNVFLNILTGVTAVSIGGLVDIVICVFIKNISKKIKEKYHIKKIRESEECRQLINKVTEMKKNVKKTTLEIKRLDKENNEIFSELTKEEEKLMQEKQQLESLEREIINFVLDLSTSKLDNTNELVKKEIRRR